jgi:hypothetical protein
MSNPNPDNRKLKLPSLPTWTLMIGLFGIINFLAIFWFRIPPGEGVTIYFWFVQLYDYILLPSLLFFPVSIFIFIFWFSRFTEIPIAKVIVLIVGIVFSVLCFIPAFGASAFVSTLRIIGKVNQNDHIYYLVKQYDYVVPYYFICESDKIGFSGQCMIIGWKGDDDDDPKIYIDQITNLVTVESENPSFIWMNSVPPNCTNGFDENDDTYFVGGCIPNPP